MKPSRHLWNLLRRTTPPGAVIKKKAHAATLAFAALLVPSVCAVYFYRAGLKEGEQAWVWAAMTMWKVHVVVATIAILLWIIERPSPTKYIAVPDPDEDEEDSASDH